jgi:hypothetical protein
MVVGQQRVGSNLLVSRTVDGLGRGGLDMQANRGVQADLDRDIDMASEVCGCE